MIITNIVPFSKMNCPIGKLTASDADDGLLNWIEPELEIKLGEPAPSTSPNTEVESEFLNPWPYLNEFFKFVGFRGKDNVEFQCLFCMPVRKTLSTSIKSHANLKKHVGRVHSHVFEQYQQCVKDALNAYKKSRRGDPQVLEALEKERVKQQLIIREALAVSPRAGVQSLFDSKVDLELASELALNPLHNKWMASEMVLHPPEDGSAVKSEPPSPASPMPSSASHSTATALYPTITSYSPPGLHSTAAPYSTAELSCLTLDAAPSVSYNNLFPKKRKKILDDRDKVLQLALQKLTQPTHHEVIDEFSHFGRVVSHKLRKMDPEQRLFVERVINDALFKGSMGTMTANAQIVNVISNSPGIENASEV